MKFTEVQLESAIIELLGVEGYQHVLGKAIERLPKKILAKLSDIIFSATTFGKFTISNNTFYV
jgi:hypothetical protein